MSAEGTFLPAGDAFAITAVAVIVFIALVAIASRHPRTRVVPHHPLSQD